MNQSMGNENTVGEQHAVTSKGIQSVKLRVKERHRSHGTTPTNTDINDPENLDYEEEDVTKLDENHSTKSTRNLSEHSLDESKTLSILHVPLKIEYFSSKSIIVLKFRMKMENYRIISKI
jgi:hypothetical protein